MRKMNRVFTLLFVLLFGGVFSTPITNAASNEFKQGGGYENGDYDLMAIQPTTFNWTRQSRFKGSEHHDLKWSFQTGDMLESSPAIGADGFIYVGSSDGKLYALNPNAANDSDRVKWVYETGGWITASPVIGKDGTIYVGSYDGNLYALNPNATNDSDRVKWFYETGDWLASSPAIGADGTIYISSYDGKLYALDPNATNDSDRVKWFYDIGDWLASSPAIGADGTIYLGSYDGKLYALHSNAASEADRLKWTYETGLVIQSSPAIGADGTIYVGSYNGKLYALNPYAGDTDRVKWTYETGAAIVSSPAIDEDGTVYIGSSDGKLYALDSNAINDSDRVKWFFETEGGVRSSALIDADGTIYVGSYDGKLYALDSHAISSSDRLKWFYKTGKSIYSSPVISMDGTIYLGSLDHKLYALGTIALAAPEEVTANADDGSVQLTWKEVVGATSYKIYKYQGAVAPDDPTDWESVNQESVREAAYTINNLTASKTYWFTIKAVSDGGSESEFSQPVSAVPRTANPLPPTSGGGSGHGRDFSSNADLQTLEIWINDGLKSIDLDFSPDKLLYQIETDANQIELRVSTVHSASKVTWNEQPLMEKIGIELHEGENVIEISVHAEDGTKKVYTVTIYRKEIVEPGKPEAPKLTFIDIKGHWAEKDINYASEEHIINGFPDGTFKPNQPITRAEFTVMLANVLKLDGKSVPLRFTDNNQISFWAKQAVAQLVTAGIVNGYDDGSFRPNAYITRAEMATMIARALLLPSYAWEKTSFADDHDIPQWAKGAVAALHDSSIINGRGNNKFLPNEMASRAEAVVVLLRLSERI